MTIKRINIYNKDLVLSDRYYIVNDMIVLQKRGTKYAHRSNTTGRAFVNMLETRGVVYTLTTPNENTIPVSLLVHLDKFHPNI